MFATAALWHGVMTLTTPGLAAENAECAEPCTSNKAVLFHGLKKVLRACRSESTTRSWAADGMKNWRNETLITTNEDADDQSHGAEAAGFKKSP